MFSQFNVWLLRMTIWELTGIVSYTFLYTLLESILVFFALILGLLMLPKRWGKDRVISLTSVLIICTSIAAVVLHLYEDRLGGLNILTVFGFYLLLMFAGFSLVVRRERIDRWINGLVDRITTLSFFYIFIDLIGVGVVIFRNISG